MLALATSSLRHSMCSGVRVLTVTKRRNSWALALRHLAKQGSASRGSKEVR